MRDEVTMLRRLSLTGCIPKIFPDNSGTVFATANLVIISLSNTPPSAAHKIVICMLSIHRYYNKGMAFNFLGVIVLAYRDIG